MQLYTKRTNLLAVVFCLHIVTDVCNRINNAFWYRYLFDVCCKTVGFGNFVTNLMRYVGIIIFHSDLNVMGWVQ